jgi:hypothetical protein
VSSGGASVAPKPDEDAPPLPDGLVLAAITGGTYWASTAAVDKVLSEHYTPSGTKLRKLVVDRSNGEDDNTLTHQETAAFYSEATPFELAVVLAWYNEEAAR